MKYGSRSNSLEVRVIMSPFTYMQRAKDTVELSHRIAEAGCGVRSLPPESSSGREFERYAMPAHAS